MSKSLTHIFGLVLLLVIAIGTSSCEDNPVRPKPRQRPSCWKPLEPPEFSLGVAADDPIWSTDGSRILFRSDFDSCNDFSNGLYIINKDGSGRYPIPDVFSVYRWLPGDTQLLVNLGNFSGGELAIFDLQSFEIEKLGVLTSMPSFDLSVGGRYVYFVDDSVWINEYDLETGQSERIVQGSIPSISPDRSKVAYGTQAGMNIFYRKDSSVVTFGIRAGLAGDWALDGSEFFYDLSPDKIMRADTLGNESLLTTGVRGPSISPDGRELIYIDVSNYRYFHIWSYDLVTGLKRQITE